MISKEQIKTIRSLHQKKFRDKHQQFIIEGFKMIESAIQFFPECLIQILGTENLPIKTPKKTYFHLINDKSLKQISALQHPQKWVAVCNFLSFKKKQPDFLIALDTIQDPGNLGTILRLASWFGIEHIVASKETVDCYNPKVIQASMGAIFNVNIEYVDLEKYLSKNTLPVYGAVLDGTNIYTKKLEKKGVLLLGNEGSGINSKLLPFLTDKISIPKFGKGESLNVAAATAILLFKFAERQ